MPSLKDLHCFIELPNGKNHLREFGTTYGDGCVETFVAVPEQPQAFAIRLSSSKFIAPGLAMYVFIDGVYQCNRNRQNLKLRNQPDRKSLVDFVVRQKEERQENGTMIARDWNFEKLDIISANEIHGAYSAKVLDNAGCIEVVVLRCAGMRSARSAHVNVKPMNLDGAGDMPDHDFGFDGAPPSSTPQYDDHAWEYIRSGSRHGAPTIISSALRSDGPPPLSNRAYTARPQYTSPAPQISPQMPDYTRVPEGLTGSVRCGSGPVPHRIRTTSMHGPAPSIQGLSAAHMPLDPRSLDQALANIAKRSPERYYQTSSQNPTISVEVPNAPPSHIPGSWPEPNRSPASAFVIPVQDIGTVLEFPPPAAALGLQSDLHGAHNSWNQLRPEPSSGGWNGNNGWESGEEGRESSVWNSGDTWGSSRYDSGRNASKSERVPEQTYMTWDAPAQHPPSPATQTARTGHWTHSSDFQTARSRPSASGWDTDNDGEGWTHIEASSESSGSWFMPVDPSESISHVAGPSVTVSAVNPAPFVDELSGKFLSSKKDEKAQRRSMATAPTASLAPSVPVPCYGFSTFEKSVRSAVGNGKAASTWKVDSSDFLPKAWPALEKGIMPHSLLKDSFTIGNGYGTAHDDKDWGKPVNNAAKNGWTAKGTAGSPVDRPYLLQENSFLPNDNWTIEEDQGGAVKETSWDISSKPKITRASDTSWQADMNGWSVPQKANSMVDGRNPWADTDEPKSQPSNTRLTKHRQLRCPVTKAADKGQRQFPPPIPIKGLANRSKVDEMDAEPLLKVNKADAAKTGVEHQVRAGKGSKYGHAIGRPEYLDHLEKPYAVFRFKYRAHGTLRKILGKDIIPSDAARLTTSPIDRLSLDRPTASMKVGDVKQQLKKVPKDALIDGLLDLQTKLEKKMKGPELDHADTAGINRTRDWVTQQSRATSVHDKKKENHKGGGSWSSEDGWN